MASKAILMGKPGQRQVEEASQRLKRMFLIERELMKTLGGYLVSVSDWELKKRLPKHIWQDSLRANALRTRVLELRYPRRDVDHDHDANLQRLLAALIRCGSDAALLEGVYAIKSELCDAYEAYLAAADPLDDAPTIEFMAGFVPQLKRQIAEAERLYAGLPERAAARPTAWQAAIAAHFGAIGGVTGPERPEELALPHLLQRPEYVPPLHPARDPKFEYAAYHLPKEMPVKFIDRQVWQGINHVNEIFSAEITALVLWKWDGMPWEFYLDCARWSFDEARHCMMGEERLQAWGFEAGVDYPICADPYVSNSAYGEEAVFALLHRFEMNGPNLKSKLKQEFEAVGDTASSQDFDYDWADESIHLQYGYKWLLHRMGGDNDKYEEIRETAYHRYWKEFLVAEHEKWDYEPFRSRIAAKIEAIEAGAGHE